MDSAPHSLREEPLFDGRSLLALIVPLLIDQLLVVFMGAADTFMLSSQGTHVVSAVSLVDNINILFNQILGALATGGSVIASQYLGRGDRLSACQAAKQLFWVGAIVGALVGAVTALFPAPILTAWFGDIEPDILGPAGTYLLVSALSYPFISLYSAGAAMYRAMRSSKTAMFVSLIMNVVKLALGALMIFAFRWGILGAALSSLAARAVGAVIYCVLIRHPTGEIFIGDLLRFEWRKDILSRILSIGLPTGLENGVFQIGRLMVMRFVTMLGASALAANAMAGQITNFAMLPGNAISLALVTVFGTCMGAGRVREAQRSAYKLMLASAACLGVTNFLSSTFAAPLVSLFGIDADASQWAVGILHLYFPFSILLWTPSFVTPNALRAAGDARFTMVVSIVSMCAFRIGLSYLFAIQMGMGIAGVWNAMYVDWCVRSLVFGARFLRGRWKSLRVI